MATATVTQSSLGPLPDFPYLPSRDVYQEESARYQDKCQSAEPLPKGFPQVVSSPLAWESAAIEQEKSSWTFNLSDSQLESIDAAIKSFEASGQKLEDLSPATFVLDPSLVTLFREASKTLYDGVGFMLIKGVNPQQYTVKQNMMIQTGISSYFGDLRGYNGPKGKDVVAHVRDLRTFFPKSDIISPTFTSKAMTMHTDLGDNICLYTVNRGGIGGSFRLASSLTVYNRLAATRPDVIKTLSENIVFDPLHNDIPAYERPLLHMAEGRVLLQSFRRPFTGFGDTPRSASLPPLTEAQKDALNTLYFTGLAESFTIDFENGDLLVFNNLALLHARDAYTPSEETPRHLLKMYVRDSKRGWKVPPVLEEQWESLYRKRGGENYPLSFPTSGEIPKSGWSQNG